MSRAVHALAVAAGLSLLSWSAAAAHSQRPDFSGAWLQDTAASRALTEKHGQPWRVAGAGASGAGDANGNKVVILAPVTIVTQTAAEIVLERRFEGEVLSREVFKLDGSVSVNASRISSSRSTTAWKGASLVTSGTAQFDFTDAVDAAGKPIPQITRQFVTTRSLMPDGTMQVESRTTQSGTERVTWSVLVRVKPS